MPRPPRNHAIAFWRSSELPDLELRESRFRSITFRAHMHAVYSIGLIDHGLADASVRRSRFSARAGQIVTIEPFAVHACHPTPATGLSYRMFYVGTTWFDLAKDRILRFPSPLIDDPALFLRLAQLFDRLQEAEHPGSLRCDVSEAMAQVKAHGAVDDCPDAEDEPPIRALCRRLTREPVTDASIETLAADIGLSRAHFSRSFKTEMGLTPHAFVSLMRVEHAKQLLIDGAPIASAAVDAGFSDQSHFARVFRRFAGATPAQYRAEAADGC